MSSLQLRAFRPLGTNRTVNLLTTTGSVSLLIPQVPFGTRSLRVVNAGTDTTFIEFAGAAGATAAVTTSMPMLPNTVEVFTLANDIITLRVIGTAGGNTLYITYGEGL